ncbi:right-handed parallel beta-helix repeat-containing protein [Paenibacillus nasutitermitis]|uniref:Right handed beta helix domain-containing protein n=1 Tax=Paenibacillus nasutitermitis TaxID=1652958 RepID=A0A916YNL1_9BACL|nr:right-handed parallel beta-helix repeat-containing protein [Paenibacillus nasutitermitis]GGD53881.1 hypothetical protein GCM10010911_09250 [Paenibacillus nasutitermitis]
MSVNELYVSTLGKDTWTGRLPEPHPEDNDGPLATIAGARDAIRHLKQSALISGAVTVWLRGGHYHQTEPVVFTPEDSAAVTYAAYPGETPVVDGGRRLSGWREETIGGIAMWVADAPVADGDNGYFRQLFVNGERRSRTRLPKQGFYWMKDVPGTGFQGGEMSSDLFAGTDTFVCAQGDIDASWRNRNDIDVVAVHYWIEERMPVASFNPDTGEVKSSRKSMFVLKDDVARRYAKYYVENVFEALTDPGQWYLDRTAGKVYYIPLPGEALAETELVACSARQLLKLEGKPEEEKYVEHLSFQGLTFAHTDWIQPKGGGERFELPGIDFAAAPQAAFHIPGVVHMRGVRYCSIEDCRIERIGWYGIELSEGCMSNRIVGNTISDMGAGGIKLDGADASGSILLRTGSNRITDNHIHAGGRIFHSACGILSVHSAGNTFSHNHIHDLYYTGISCGWVWGYAENVSKNNRIEKNHIHDIGHGLLSDMGGIYTLGVQPGTVIRGNLIHDIEKCNYGGWAIYPDEGSSHILIENNICFRTSSQVFHQHYGRENIVRNNIFAFGREGQAALGRAEDHLSFTFEKNIIVADGQPMFVAGYSGQLDKKGFSSDLNLFWDISGGEPESGNQKFDEQANFSLNDKRSMEDMNQLGYDLHSIYADPRLEDPAGGNFTLLEDSPAWALGFQPIDLTDVGPRSAADRE